MATVVVIMDRPGFGENTDVIVVVDPGREALTWVPRDLWSERLGDRVSHAYAHGGHEALADSLDEHGIAVQRTLCVGREAVEAGVEDLTVLMPVRERMEFWYPLTPTSDIKQGRKRIAFEPPIEKLSGERLHQWLGARRRIDRPGDDRGRIERQQQIVAVALGDSVDFRRFLRRPEALLGADPEALGELAQVRPPWRFETFGPLLPERIDGKLVLVRSSERR